jgi:gluconokinase
MLLILFGLPGAGKNFVGEILAQHFGFYFYDADSDLTADMQATIRQEQLYTSNMRERFFQIVIKKIQGLQKKHPRIAMTQTLAKVVNRQQILDALPHAKFIRIDAKAELIKARLKQRGDWVTLDYAEKIRAIFEPEGVVHGYLNNDSDKAHIIRQLRSLCPSIPPQ